MISNTLETEQKGETRLTDVAARALTNGRLQLRAERARVLAPANLEPARVQHEARDVGPLVE